MLEIYMSAARFVQIAVLSVPEKNHLLDVLNTAGIDGFTGPQWIDALWIKVKRLLLQLNNLLTIQSAITHPRWWVAKHLFVKFVLWIPDPSWYGVGGVTNRFCISVPMIVWCVNCYYQVGMVNESLLFWELSTHVGMVLVIVTNKFYEFSTHAGLVR